MPNLSLSLYSMNISSKAQDAEVVFTNISIRHCSQITQKSWTLRRNALVYTWTYASTTCRREDAAVQYPRSAQVDSATCRPWPVLASVALANNPRRRTSREIRPCARLDCGSCPTFHAGEGCVPKASRGLPYIGSLFSALPFPYLVQKQMVQKVKRLNSALVGIRPSARRLTSPGKTLIVFSS